MNDTQTQATENTENEAPQAPVRVTLQGGDVHDIDYVENGTVGTYLESAGITPNHRQTVTLNGQVVDTTNPVNPGQVGATIVVTDKTANG